MNQTLPLPSSNIAPGCCAKAWLPAQIFVRWLSIIYMAAVHVGVPREAAAGAEAGEEAVGGASSGLGWAWAAQGEAEAMEAQRTSDFVFHLLQGQVMVSCSMLLQRAS